MTTQSYSYNRTGNYGTQQRANTYTRTNNGASEPQIKKYLELCQERKLVPQNYTQWTYDEMHKQIGDLIAFRPATDAQRAMIIDLCKRTETPEPTDAQWAKLSGVKDGSASVLIQRLQAKEREMGDVIAPHERQLEQIANMFLCPDVNFADINIPTAYELDETHIFQEVNTFGDPLILNGVRITTERKLKRKLTRLEVIEHAKQITMNEATSFIEKYRDIFARWDRYKISDEQVAMIRTWESRIRESTRRPRVIAQAADIEGNVYDFLDADEDQVQVYDVITEDDKSAKGYSPPGYEPLDDYAINQFTRKQASDYIDMLRAEYKNIETRGFAPEDVKDETFEVIRGASDASKLNTEEYTHLNDVLYSLCAVTGEDDQQLLESAFYLYGYTDEGKVNASETNFQTNDAANKRKYIKEYMERAVQDKYITVSGLLKMCERSNTAMDILFEDNPLAKELFDMM